VDNSLNYIIPPPPRLGNNNYHCLVVHQQLHFGNTLWQLVMLLTVLMLPIVTVSIMFVLNTVSLFYGTINTIPFLVNIKLFFIKLFFLRGFVTVPLCMIGTLIGRHTLEFGSIISFAVVLLRYKRNQ
jgi:Endomembrane protein 70